MGWSGGSLIAERVWQLVQVYVPGDCRERIAREIIDIFEDEDADTMEEARTLWADANMPKCSQCGSTAVFRDGTCKWC